MKEITELIDRMIAQKEARETLWKKRERTPWGRILNKRTKKKELQAAANWMLHGPGGP